MTRAPDPDALQRRAADPAASVWVEASAGSGKTKMLTDRVLTLMLEGTPPERILCLTFTKAAAAEMAKRIDDTLGAWAVSGDRALGKALRGLMGRAPDAALKRRARQLFAHVLDVPGGLKIQTIHSFCQSLLARFPLESGVAPHAEVMDERSAAELLHAARDKVLAAAATERALGEALTDVTAHIAEQTFAELMEELAGERGRLEGALEAHGGVAGATAAVCRLLGVAPGEREEDVIEAASIAGAFDAAALECAAQALLGGTGKSDRERGRTIADWLSADTAARVAGFEGYQHAFLKKTDLMPYAHLATNSVLEAAPEVADIMAAEAARLVAVHERRKAAVTARATAGLLRLGAALLDEYRRAKAALARLDYDDLIYKASRLVKDAGAAWVLYKLDGGIDHILIDESQDTNPEQWAVVAALAEEFYAGSGAREEPRTVFAVGDFKQSIFGFRRADPTEAERMRRHFAERIRAARREWREVPIDISFRSTESVLQAVDATFAREPAQDGVVERGRTLEHRAHRTGHAGLVELWPAIGPRGRAEPEPWRPPTETVESDDPAARLARVIAHRIGGWIGQEKLPARGRTVRPGDLMVLVRRRSGFVEALVRALKDVEVPVAGVDRMVLTDQLAVMDLTALAQFLLLPEDDLNLATVLKGPLIGFDDDDLFRLARDRGETSLWRRLKDLAREEPRFAAAHEWLSGQLARADYTPPYELFAQVLAAPTIAGETGRQRMTARLGREAEDPIDEFLALALAYERAEAPSLQGFLHWVAAGETEVTRDLEQSGRDEVRVLTVHGAPGRPAPIVSRPDTWAPPRAEPHLLWHDGLPLWPPRRAHEECVSAAARAAARRRRDEEYRRLLYVAMTRAEDRLYVCGWETRQRAPKDCWYDLVHAGIAGIADSVPDPWLARELEDPAASVLRLSCAQDAPPAAKPETEDRPAAPDLPAFALALPPAEPAPPRPLAPSRPEAAEPPVRSPLGDDGGRRFRRGLLMHRLLQTLPELPPEARRPAAERFLARPVHGLDPAERAGLAEEACAVMREPALSALFGPTSRAEVPVIGRIGKIVVSGQIDRLVVSSDEVLIVDYKTQRLPPASPEETPVAYLRQMAAYRAVLRRIYADRPVRCALIWTDGPRLMTLPDGLLDAHAPAPDS
ncbi:MAG: double-strand break repair helicase AddA [Kiloniellales bacterium]